MFNPAYTEVKKECEIQPPSVLEAFLWVFDPKAPARCRWCAAAVRPGGAYMHYCGDKCHFAAHPPSKCARCGGKDHCIMPNPLARCLDQLPAPTTHMAKCKGCGLRWGCDATTMAYDPAKMQRSATPAEPAYKQRRRS